MAYDPYKYYFEGQPFPIISNPESNGGLRYYFEGSVYSPLPTSVRYALSPSADSVDGTWSNNAGGSELFSVIDETNPDDADYIRSAEAPSNDTCKIKLATPTRVVDAPMIVSYRFAEVNGGYHASPTLVVRLLEGTTEIAAWTESTITTSFVQKDRTLTPAQLASIGNTSNLYLEFKANAP
jgi:hypothetical protein